VSHRPGSPVERIGHEQGLAGVANPKSMDEDYHIVSVEPTDAPGGLGGDDWYRYVIDQGSNRIYGYRQGSRQGITKSLEELVLRLNERRFGPKGRVSLYMSAHGKPATAK